MEGLREFLRSDLLLLAGEYPNFDFLVILALLGGVSLLLAQPIGVNIKLILFVSQLETVKTIYYHIDIFSLGDHYLVDANNNENSSKNTDQVDSLFVPKYFQHIAEGYRQKSSHCGYSQFL